MKDEKIRQLEARHAELHKAQKAAILALLTAPVKTPELRAAIVAASKAREAAHDELHVAYYAQKKEEA